MLIDVKTTNKFNKHIKLFFKAVLSISLCAALVFASVSFGTVSTQAAEAEGEISSSMTGYSSLNEFQKARMNMIVNETFYDNSGSTITYDNSSYSTISTITNLFVKEDNEYFNWADTSETVDEEDVWDGSTAAVTPETETITYEADSVENGAYTDGTLITVSEVSKTYTVYNVSTAAELRYAMEATDINKKINLLNDIDLGGQNNSIWSPVGVSTGYTVYIEGNGYTVYNMKTAKLTDSSTARAAFFSTVLGCCIVKNLSFSDCLSLGGGGYCTAILAGYICHGVYFENINISDSFIWSNNMQVGALIGRTELSKADVFVNNCSSSSCIVFGSDHVGGLTGCQYLNDRCKVRYNAEFPASPEAWIMKNDGTFPIMFENCYSVDCEVFSIGSEGDSGAFISCGSGNIVRNCFTNNTIYGTKYTGAFIGDITDTPYCLYDDLGSQIVTSYFDSCYSSGTVEGITGIGGFVGLERSNSSTVTIYRNCYTTASVGLDYSGSNIGGFVGKARHNGEASVLIGYDSKGNKIWNTADNTTKEGSVYINCYAAGEVGNIQTDTDCVQSGSYNYIGGFVGAADSDIGYFYNCYYDKQTTAMNERACGMMDNYYDSTEIDADDKLASQIPGVTGVYSLGSIVKSVQGLATTDSDENTDNSFNLSVDMSASGTDWEYDDTSGKWINSDTTESDWYYTDGYYPQLQTLSSEETVKEKFGTAHYGTGATEEIKAQINEQLSEKADLVRNYSAASAATVLLDHWDYIMDIETDASEIGSYTVYDTVRNITSPFTFSASYKSGDETHYADWDFDGVRNTKDSFADTVSFSLEYTVDGNEITGTFSGDIITIESAKDSDGLTYYYVNKFISGKEWVAVTANVSDNDSVVGNRSIRLIPTVYLEAGNDATVYVNEGSGSTNNVKLDKNDTKYVKYICEFTDSNGNDITDLEFSYYNFALTACYLITDTYGVGYYGNYNPQKIIGYTDDSNYTRLESDSKSAYTDYSGTYSYFAMSSVYAQSASYTDEENYVFSSSANTASIGTTNLGTVNTVVDQKLIGSSNKTNRSDETGATVVKVYKQEDDGTTTAVNIDSTAAQDTDAYKNYLKWSGQQAFETSDGGTYEVVYYWSLSDGRYISDTKSVKIVSGDEAVDIPITKELVGASDSEEYYFTFNVKMYTYQNGEWDWSDTDYSDFIHTTGSGTYNDEIEIYCDISTDATYYYWIYEEEDDTYENKILYDSTSYIIEVTVSDGKASITGITHYNSSKSKDEDYSEDYCMFTNTELMAITIQKTVENEKTDKDFEFNVTLTKSDKTAYNTASYTNNGSGSCTADENGTYSFSLKDKESITFYVPYGYNYNVQELNSSGYSVNIEVLDSSGSSIYNGSALTYENTNVTSDQTVKYTNTLASLPFVGGTGLYIFISIGLILCTSSIAYMLIVSRKKNKEQ